jgi:hypothetical protein
VVRKTAPPATAGRGSSQAQRAQRLAEALRANLRRRKEQARAKADAAAAAGGTEKQSGDPKRGG